MSRSRGTGVDLTVGCVEYDQQGTSITFRSGSGSPVSRCSTEDGKGGTNGIACGIIGRSLPLSPWSESAGGQKSALAASCEVENELLTACFDVSFGSADLKLAGCRTLIMVRIQMRTCEIGVAMLVMRKALDQNRN